MENWHGKPLNDRADEAIKTISALIKNPGAPKIKPSKPVEDRGVVSRWERVTVGPDGAGAFGRYSGPR